MSQLLNVEIFAKQEARKMYKVREMVARKKRLVNVCALSRRKQIPREVVGSVLDLLNYYE